LRYTHIGSSGDRKTTADRWPRFVDAVTGTTSGEPVFRAVHAVPLRLRRQAIGAMNLRLSVLADLGEHVSAAMG